MRLRQINFVVLLACGALAACAGDNPENVPLYGEWELTGRVDSLSIDGMQVPPDQFPPEFGDLAKTEKLCGEPMFINRDWQEDDINRRVRGTCTLREYVVAPIQVTGSGMCENIAPEAGFNPEFLLRVDQAENAYKIVLTMQGWAAIPGQSGRHYIKAIAVQDGWRKGDC